MFARWLGSWGSRVARKEVTGTGPWLFSFLCMAGAVAVALYFADLRHIRIDWSFRFVEVFMRHMDWPWATGGFVIAVAGCAAGEKARNRGAGFPGTVVVTGCLMLALAYAMILIYSVGGFERMIDILR